MLQKPYYREQIHSPYFASQIRGKYGKSVAVNTSGTGVQDTSNLEIITQGQVYRILLTLRLSHKASIQDTPNLEIITQGQCTGYV